MGSENIPGVAPRFLNDLFRRINQDTDIEFVVNISFMEIYNEKIRDLLTDDYTQMNKNLRVRDSPQTGTYVEDLTFQTVESYEQAMELLHSGNARRVTAATTSNEKSSRSHSIFNIIMMQNKKINTLENESDEQTSCISKIYLVDLAGSERANQMNHDRFREGTMINKSLLTLGKVINQLAECNNNQTKPAHIPYRDSILTYLLKDSLGGNSRTSMIATISPAKLHLDETISTLRYASTAQKIVNIVYKNEDPKVQIINSLLKQISSLKKEVDRGREDTSKSSSSSFEESQVNEKENSDDNSTTELRRDYGKKMKLLDKKCKEILKLQKEVNSLVSEIKHEFKNSPAKFPTYQSNLTHQIKNILSSVKDMNHAKETTDFPAKTKQMIDKFEKEFEEAETDNKTKEKYKKDEEKKKEDTNAKEKHEETTKSPKQEENAWTNKNKKNKADDGEEKKNVAKSSDDKKDDENDQEKNENSEYVDANEENEDTDNEWSNNKKNKKGNNQKQESKKQKKKGKR